MDSSDDDVDTMPVSSASYWAASHAPRAREGRVGTGDPSMRLSRDDLAFLEKVDVPALAHYLENDVSAPPPTDEFSPHLKLMKAIQIISNRSARGRGTILSDWDVSRLLDLLASVMMDMQVGDFRAGPDAGDEEGEEQRAVDRIRLSLGLVPRSVTQNGGTSTVTASDSLPEAVYHSSYSSSPDPPTPAIPQLATLFAENTKLAAAAFRPTTIFDPVRPDNDLDGVAAREGGGPTGTSKTSQNPSRPCCINRLPHEVLQDIFTFAHAASSERRDWSTHVEPVEEESLLKGSKPAALRFALGLAEVCSSWTEPGREIAFRHLHVHHGLGLVKLNDLLDNGTGGNDLAGHIHSFDLLILAGADPSNDASGFTSSHSPFRRRRDPFALQEAGSGGKEGPGEEHNAGELFEQLIAKTRNLERLSLRVFKPMQDSGRWGGPGDSSYAEFLEAPILRALTSLPSSLTSLHLHFTVDFEELETILSSTPSLEELKIDCLDNISNSNQVVSTSPCPAKKLCVVHLGRKRDPATSSLSGAQLSWLLEPSATANALRDVQIAITAVDLTTKRGRGLFGPVGGQGGSPPPFAFASFADLLARCGALEKLYLHDASFSGMKDPSLAQAPHNDSLDHALSSLTSLRSLALTWSYTSSLLLSSLSSLSHLEHLSLYGSPSHTQTSSTSFAAALETDFPALKSLRFAGGVTGGGGGFAGGAAGWTGGGISVTSSTIRSVRVNE